MLTYWIGFALSAGQRSTGRLYSRRWLALFATISLLVAWLIEPASASAPKAKAEILWDAWGVPHIFAEDAESAFRAFGWAQMRSHGDLVLRLYAQARGRGAEFYGADYLAADQATRLLGIPERGMQWYLAQPPAFRRKIDAFVAGMNEYARQNPDELAAGRSLLPVTGADVFAHIGRVMALFVAASSECGAILPGLKLDAQPGGHGWAVAPAHSVSGNAMLLASPSLPWGDLQTFYEAHIVAPGVDVYGAALVGFPTLAIAFNDTLGWTHTLNPIDVCDLYLLSPAAASLDAGYKFDGQLRAFETVTQTIKIARPDGSLRAEPFVIRRAVQGPVITQGGQSFAMRMAGQEQFPVAGLAEQWWEMGKARTLAEFQAALRRMQLPIFTVIYADRDGQILSLFAGNLSVRARGDLAFWALPAPGDTSALVWTQAHTYDELPKAINPPSGWVQNASGVPWYMTLPALDPADYPDYMAPRLMTDARHFLREQRGIKMLLAQNKLTVDQLLAATNSTRSELADRLLDKLIVAARQSDSGTARQAADVLARWDRQAEAESKGMALFALWYQHWVALMSMRVSAANPMLTPIPTLLSRALFYDTRWDPADPLNTPTGFLIPSMAVQALETAALQLQRMGLALDVAWGDVARFRRGPIDLPATGGSGDLGILRAMDFAPGADGRLQVVAGPSYVALVEFGDPVRAWVLTAYGNASQPNSPHDGDQLRLAAQKEMRPALRTRAAILAHLEARTLLGE
ncbi:MAG: penicillin acylase family protein [Chloroflexi bacterium]|nr:penicillin acylase family protein [Chloroflexota bacterium]